MNILVRAYAFESVHLISVAVFSGQSRMAGILKSTYKRGLLAGTIAESKCAYSSKRCIQPLATVGLIETQTVVTIA